MKNQNGITLIALVITIIVLLILAGVGIAMLSGDNGLLTQASDAAIEQSIANAKEKALIEINSALVEQEKNKYVNNAEDSKAITFVDENLSALATELADDNNVDVEWKLAEDSKSGTFTITSQEKDTYTTTLSVDEDGKVTEVTSRS